MPIDFGPGDLYIQLYSSSPAPKRDYHGLTITSKYVILNSWDISHGPHVFPRKMRTPLEELTDDIQLQKDISHLFGSHVLDYALQIASNEKNLQTLPNKIFLKILRLLAANDILHLGQTSKIFFEICNSNLVWKIIYRKKLKKGLTNQELLQSEKQSWRYLLKKKIMEKAQMAKNAEKKMLQFPKPPQDILDSISRYSKPKVYKKRTPIPVPKDKLDLDIDFKIIEYQKNKSKIVRNVPKTTHSTPNVPQNSLISFLTESSISPENLFGESPKNWTSPTKMTPISPSKQLAKKSVSTIQVQKSESPKMVTKKNSTPNLTQKISKTSILPEKSRANSGVKSRLEKMDLRKSDTKKSDSSQQKMKAKM